MSTACCERAEERELTSEELVEDLSRRPVTEQVELLRTSEPCRDPQFVQLYLDYLNELRFDDPKAASLGSSALSDQVILSLDVSGAEKARMQCQAVAVFSSAERLRGRFEIAAEALRSAVHLASAFGDRQSEGLLLVRAAYLLRDQGLFSEAYRALGEALKVFSQDHDLKSLVSCLVDRGIVARDLGDNDRALGAFMAGLAHLGDDQARLKAVVLSGLASLYQEQGRWQLAEECLEEAAQLARRRIDRAKLLWQRALIAFDQGEYSRCEEQLRQVYSMLAVLNPYEGALLTVDLVRTLFCLGDIREACSIAKQMATFLAPLRRNQIASAAIMALMRDALAGDLTMALIETARSKIQTASCSSGR